MLEHSEIKLSRLVSAFAREALSVLPPHLELPNMLPDLSERVDTLLQITDLCRSGLLQEQQNRRARLPTYDQRLTSTITKIQENRAKLQMTLASELIAERVVARASYPLIAEMPSSMPFTSDILKGWAKKLLTYNSARFEALRLEIQEEIRLRILEQRGLMRGVKLEVKEGSLHMVEGSLGLELTLTKEQASDREYLWILKRLYHRRNANPKFQMLRDPNDPLLCLMSASIDDSLRREILENFRLLIVGINELMQHHPQRKQTINESYLQFVHYCLKELNIWFLLAKVGRKMPSEDSSVRVGLAFNTFVGWSMPKPTAIFNEAYVPTKSISLEGEGFTIQLAVLPGEVVDLAETVYKIGSRDIHWNMPPRTKRPTFATQEVLTELIKTARLLRDVSKEIDDSNRADTEVPFAAASIEWSLVICLKDGFLFCEDPSFGRTALKNIQNFDRDIFFGVVYKWSEETVLAIYDADKKHYRLASEISHTSTFTGLRNNVRTLKQVLATVGYVRHYALVKAKYPSFKAKLDDIVVDDRLGFVSCSIIYPKRGQVWYRILIKDPMEYYGDIEARTGKDRNETAVNLLNRLQLQPSDPINISLFCERLMVSFVYLIQLEEAETKPSFKVKIFANE